MTPIDNSPAPCGRGGRKAGVAPRILVIKLGALGNMALSLGSFEAIRRHHADAEITLLTTRPYAAWMAASPYFDRIWTDDRPAWWNVPGWLRLRRSLVAGGFARVYDLQTSSRSNLYARLFPSAARPEWSGVAPGCSHPDRESQRNGLHDIDRQVSQLHQAGVDHVRPPDLGWCAGDLAEFGLPKSFALLVPGSSAHRPAKRWPVERYATLAAMLAGHGLMPVVLGAAAEAALAGVIGGTGAPAFNLAGRTDLGQIVSLARAATLAVGNDTGPMHLIAAAGCPSVVLFSRQSDPELCAPRGPSVSVMRQPDLAALAPQAVLAAALGLASASAEARPATVS